MAQSRPGVLFVLIDGLADVSLRQLSDKTPLEASKTPALDAIAQSGVNGLMDPVAPGLACGSDTAHMSIFGYDPFTQYRGRGSFEAMGAGLPMDKGDVAFKCNFATVARNDQGELIVTRRRVDRNFPSWGTALCSFLDGMAVPEFPGIRVAVKYATEHRCGVVFHGEGLCDRMTGTDPLKDNLPLQTSRPLDASSTADYSSRVLNAVSKAIHTKLSTHPINQERVAKNLPPANIVLLRGPGERINVPTFEEKHGMRAFMIAPTCIIAGLGMSLGVDVLKAPGATGDYHTNLLSKAETALQAFETGKYDFGFVHVKAVDDAGHDKDIEKKMHFIEKVDVMVTKLMQGVRERERLADREFCIVVTGDHTTPVLYGDHSFEPVPFTISRTSTALDNLERSRDAIPSGRQPATSVLSDSVADFSEISAARGILGRFGGDQLMEIVKNFRRCSSNV